MGKIRKKLDIIKERTTFEKKNNGSNQGRRRNLIGKFRDKGVDRRRQRQNGQYGRPILWVIEKFLRMRKLKREVVLWLGRTTKSLFIFLFFWTYYMSQTLFGHISINSLTILMVLRIKESLQKDLLINANYISRQSILAKILSRLTSNYQHLKSNNWN